MSSDSPVKRFGWGQLGEAQPDMQGDEAAKKVKLWATKGVLFWSALSGILVRTRPNTILEFGGGRSTTFLADYVHSFRKEGMTIEQSPLWHKKIRNDLKFMSVSGHTVHHVPLSAPADGPGWYDFEIVDRLLGDRAFDLVFVDGPVGDTRSNPRGQAIIARAAREARLIIFDDLHRDYNVRFFDELTRRFPDQSKFFYPYRRNTIAFVAAAEWTGIVRDTLQFLGLPYEHHIPAVAPKLAAG
jgi:hypothetical protein